MMKLNLLIVTVLVFSAIYPASSISQWFTSSYQDIRVTLQRYGRCVGPVAALRDANLNETEFLIQKIRVFLDQGNYDNEQLANVTDLMSNICRYNEATKVYDTDYPVSVDINTTSYSGPEGKALRCQAIEDVMDAMYPVFRRSALDRSEPLDFTTISFVSKITRPSVAALNSTGAFNATGGLNSTGVLNSLAGRPNLTNVPNAQIQNSTYSLIDLINTSWIQSATDLDLICNITGSVKEHIRSRATKTVAQDRALQQNTLRDFVYRLLDTLIGQQRRLYWEGNRRLEMARNALASLWARAYNIIT